MILKQLFCLSTFFYSLCSIKGIKFSCLYMLIEPEVFYSLISSFRLLPTSILFLLTSPCSLWSYLHFFFSTFNIKLERMTILMCSFAKLVDDLHDLEKRSTYTERVKEILMMNMHKRSRTLLSRSIVHPHTL